MVDVLLSNPACEIRDFFLRNSAQWLQYMISNNGNGMQCMSCVQVIHEVCLDIP
jgi:hypothetical protein